MKTRAALLALMLAASSAGEPAFAQPDTDWTAAAGVWSGQIAALRKTQATIRFCNMAVTSAVADGLNRAERGLGQALGLTRRQQREARRAAYAEVARSAGALAAPCAPDSPLVSAATASLSSLQARLVEQGAMRASVPPEPGAAPGAVVVPAQAAAVGVVPPADPNISLIQNCRAAVVKRLGEAQAAQNDVFWPQYETCITKQGVGWF
jgi:hypothetical protein